MKIPGRTTRTRCIGAAAVALVTAFGATACGEDGGSGTGEGEVEVFTWWAQGSEKEGLDALVAVFEEQNPDLTFVNGAVAGGAGSDAKNVLASRLQTNDPPGTFQAHAGAELTDYIEQGDIEPLTDTYAEQGWDQLFPPGLLEQIQQDGEYYSVPSNIHRANVVWANPAVLEEAGVDPNAEYADLDAWIADLERIQEAGITPLSIGMDWTQVHLLETVLLADLGPDAYNGLWDGSTDWAGAEVTGALEHYETLLGFTNSDRQSLDWPDATQQVIDGDAAFNVMGDWAEAAFAGQDKVFGTDYLTFPVPGTDGVFDFLADSFTLPVGAPNPDASRAWLDTVASAEGQEAFNSAKGSIPANLEADTSGLGEYQQTAVESFAQDTIVSSLAHGAAAPVSWLTDITAAISEFGSGGDVASLQEDLAATAESQLAE
ncbi:extracellular solute-binding protein [Streptomyces sp. 3MP-14]|uniref:Probable sugar-binding periplasmic protein n=1 Tax=Streptomyces mimosae TaxID=2586635 RepID=A0A5N6A1F0_9ACTN|nr:extracellular solute-binding protein [Streptomyces mimosae]KAB8173621.1 extracellular solute-binding protein [Streptomyces sp. 3MP-14]